VRRIISAAINGNARHATSATHAAQVESCLRLLVRPPPATPELSGEPAGPDDAGDGDESGGGDGGPRGRARAAGAACEWLDCAFSAGGEQEYLPQLEIRTPERERGDAADRPGAGAGAAAAAAAELCGAFRGGGGQRPSIQFVCASSFDIGKLVRRAWTAIPALVASACGVLPRTPVLHIRCGRGARWPHLRRDRWPHLRRDRWPHLRRELLPHLHRD
jgi:hypothetical protein